MNWQVKPTADLNGFDNYCVNTLGPQTTESGEPEINNIGEKTQYKNESIIHTNISNAR